MLHPPVESANLTNMTWIEVILVIFVSIIVITFTRTKK